MLPLNRMQSESPIIHNAVMISYTSWNFWFSYINEDVVFLQIIKSLGMSISHFPPLKLFFHLDIMQIFITYSRGRLSFY